MMYHSIGIIPMKGEIMKRFYIKQKIFAITDRYKVFDETQTIVYHIESKFLSLTHKMDFYRTNDSKHLYTLRRQLLTLLPKYFVSTPEGEDVAIVSKKFTLLHHKLEIESKMGHFTMEGDFLAHDFSVSQDGKAALDFHKKWLSFGDAYEITIYDDDKVEFLLALVILIDDCLHDENKRH